MTEDPAGSGPDDDARFAARLLERARLAAADDRSSDALALFEEAVRLLPPDPEVERACGIAGWGAGDSARAEHHLREAVRLQPGSAEALVDLGRCLRHFGRLDDAVAAFEQAQAIDPEAGAGDLGALHRAGWHGRTGYRDLAARMSTGEPSAADRAEVEGWAADPIDDTDATLAVEALPPADRTSPDDEPGLHWRALGRFERTSWGSLRVLRGAEAVRAVCLTPALMAEVRIKLNGETVWRGPPAGPFPATGEKDGRPLRKFVVNAWIDAGTISPGRYGLEVMFGDLRGGWEARTEEVAILPPLPAPASDAWIPVDAADPRPLDGQVAAAPSVVRPAARQLLPRQVRSVLVQRLDQLGDMALSVPAIERLRRTFPEAELVALVTPANAALARSLGLFASVKEAAFPDDPVLGRRTMTADEQRRVSAELAPYRFDVAIDLCENAASRALLRLSGAPFTFGFGAQDFPWLSADVEGYTADPRNRHESVSHAAKLSALVAWLDAITGESTAVIRRDDLPHERLGALGLGADQRYVALHTGARLPFTRWPHFSALAGLILDRTGLAVLMLGDPVPVPDDPRIHTAWGLLPFDELDLALHHAAAFVGNDSGPKHLAALRGTPVVSVHMARTNWSEWGQGGRGAIVSRRVPCAGCLIQRRDSDECGRGYQCLTDIRPEEVLDALLPFLPAR